MEALFFKCVLSFFCRSITSCPIGNEIIYRGSWQFNTSTSPFLMLLTDRMMPCTFLRFPSPKVTQFLVFSASPYTCTCVLGPACLLSPASLSLSLALPEFSYALSDWTVDLLCICRWKSQSLEICFVESPGTDKQMTKLYFFFVLTIERGLKKWWMGDMKETESEHQGLENREKGWGC